MKGVFFLPFQEGSLKMGRAFGGFLAALGACFASGFGGVTWKETALNLTVLKRTYTNMKTSPKKRMGPQVFKSTPSSLLQNATFLWVTPEICQIDVFSEFLHQSVASRFASKRGLYGDGAERIINVNLASKCSACNLWSLNRFLGCHSRG